MGRWLLGVGVLFVALLLLAGTLALVRVRQQGGLLAAAPTFVPTAAQIPTLSSATAGPLPSLPPTFTPLPPLIAAASLTPIPIPTATPMPTASATPPPTAVLPATTPYLETFRLVAFYGYTSGPELGVLGAPPREEMLQRLRGLAAEYQALSPDRTVLPTFHIIITIADGFPGDFGRYSHRTNEAVLVEWLAAAQAAGVAVVLDIQPGLADIIAEVEYWRPYLRQPHVHLAVDPEFVMAEGEVPGRQLGQIEGQQINEVQAILQALALEVGLNKVLIVHQFDPSMVLDKASIEDYANVELVIDADGFGSPQAKQEDYWQYAAEPGFEYGGFKLFYDWDSPLLTPAEVMSLEPRPAVIIYQ